MAASDDRLLPPLWIMTLIAAVLVVWLLFQLKEMLVLLIVGYAFAYVIDPIVSKLEERGINRSVGIIAVIVFFVFAVMLLFVTAVPTILEQFGNLSDNFPAYVTRSREALDPLLMSVVQYLPADLQTVVIDHSVAPLMNYVNGGFLQRVASAAGVTLMSGYSLTLTILNLFLLPFIVFYLAVDFKRIHLSALELFPVIQRARVAEMFAEMNRYVSAFVRGQLMVCSILFLLYALGLRIVGIELWFLVSVIAGFGNMIPYVGTLVGIVIASIMALVTFASVTAMLKVWLVFIIVQFLEGTFITPKVMGKNVGMSPLAVILAIFIGGTLFGLLGVFLAIPGAAVCKVLAKHLHSRVVNSV